MKTYKPLIFFLLRFLGSYVVMILLYNYYLNYYFDQGLTDPYTKFTSDTAAYIFRLLGFDAESIQPKNENFMRLILDGKNTAIVNEGCNAISVLIIFIAFILAFYTTFKQTFTFILSSLIVLIVMNLFRIVLLTYIYKYYPSFAKIGHDYLFPAIIYGSVVILWIIWIKLFVLKKNKHA